MGSSMKVHQLTRGFWDQHEPSLSLGCKRLRPLAPKLTNNSDSSSTSSSVIALDLKSFIKADHTTTTTSGPRKQQLSCNQDIIKQESSAATHQLEAHSGGTRWNPTQEQIGILEMLYKGGMRTPNAHQIEHITAQLGKYGKIEGKNVFYWFQNHKARERQKQKRNSLGLSHSPRTLAAATTISSSDASGEAEKEEDSQYKRKHRSWAIEYIEENNINRMYGSDEDGDKTLELFPLHPEGK